MNSENDNFSGIIAKVNELKQIQSKLDEALTKYNESIAELEKTKSNLVPEIMEAFKGKTEGAEKLKISRAISLLKLNKLYGVVIFM